jgi:hypothetical protein
MVLLRKKRVMAAEIEVTPGTATTLAAADGAENFFDGVIQPSITVEPRQGQGGFGKLAGVPGARMGTATFRTMIYYDGINLPFWAAVLLPACGWVEISDVFTPRTEAPGANVKTITIGCYADGKLFSIAGAMGTFQAVFPNGRPAYIDWTFTGKWQPVTNTALITPTYPTTLPLRYSTATTTFNSVALCLEQVTFDAGNTVIMRECTADETGYGAALVTDRYPKITANPESVAIATRDPHAQLLAGTESSFSLLIPVAVTGALQFVASKAQVLSTQDEDRNGLMIDAMEFGCNKNGATHDEELSISFIPA